MPNDWTEGTMYIQPNGPRGYFTQPNGPWTTVYPQQPTGNVNLFSTEPFNAQTGQFVFGCGHSANMSEIFRDFDVDTGMSVALICCPQCTFIARKIEPFEAAVTGSSNHSLSEAILYP